jgi:hypothetical protein
MANCKISGKKQDKRWNWKSCNTLRKDMGKRVKNKEWLNNKWDNEWNFSTGTVASSGGRKRHNKTKQKKKSSHNGSKRNHKRVIRKRRHIVKATRKRSRRAATRKRK